MAIKFRTNNVIKLCSPTVNYDLTIPKGQTLETGLDLMFSFIVESEDFEKLENIVSKHKARLSGKGE
jgi:hypothetical protein